MLRFEQRSKLEELPVALRWVRDVFFITKQYLPKF